jgi:hypothetical protein
MRGLFELLQHEQGKVFVVNQQGQVQCVILGPAEYERLRTGQKPRAAQGSVDTEKINQQILKAQLADDFSWPAKPEAAAPHGPRVSQVIPTGVPSQKDNDEVIDTTFDFDPPVER